MRFFGGGVGHKSTREATDHFLKDCDPLDRNLGSDDNITAPEDVIASDRAESSDEDEEEDYGYGDPFDQDIRDDDGIDDKGIEGDEPEGGSMRDGLGDDFETEIDNIDQGDEDLGFGDL
jgi:hypothetical protein